MGLSECPPDALTSQTNRSNQEDLLDWMPVKLSGLHFKGCGFESRLELGVFMSTKNYTPLEQKEREP